MSVEVATEDARWRQCSINRAEVRDVAAGCGQVADGGAALSKVSKCTKQQTCSLISGDGDVQQTTSSAQLSSPSRMERKVT